MGRPHGGFDQLRETRIILPFMTQVGSPVRQDVRPWLEAELTEKFGGFTCYQGQGACTMRDGALKTEGDWIYDVAMPERDYPKLVLIALRLRAKADQETIYLRDPYGRVFIGSDASQLCGSIG